MSWTYFRGKKAWHWSEEYNGRSQTNPSQERPGVFTGCGLYGITNHSLPVPGVPQFAGWMEDSGDDAGGDPHGTELNAIRWICSSSTNPNRHGICKQCMAARHVRAPHLGWKVIMAGEFHDQGGTFMDWWD